MSKILTIAVGSFKDILRKKIFYFILLVSLLSLFGANLLTFFDESLQVRLMKDIAFGIITLLCSLVAVLVAADLIPGEMESRSIYYLLSRPVRRWQYLVGKLLSVAAILLITIVMVGGAFVVMIVIKKGQVPNNVLTGLYFIYLKSLIVAAMTMMFSVCLSRIITVSIVIMVYCAASFKDMFVHFAGKMEIPVLGALLKSVQFLLPSFDYLAVGDAVVHNFQVPMSYLASTGFYAVGYTVACLGVALLLFSRKDL